jgi:seryl-tRNA synthetase
MHDIKWIREHPDEFDRGLARRGLKGLAQHLISIDERRRAIIRVAESWKARRNAASKEIGAAKKSNEEVVAARLMAEIAQSRESLSTLEAEQKAVDEELNKELSEIPNLPLNEVPDGENSNDNVERYHFGARRNYGFAPQQHFDLGEALGQMDFKTAGNLSGARFVVLNGGLALMERALGQFMLDLHTNEHGYTEVNPPLLVRDEAMYGTAQLPKFEDDQFFAGNSALSSLEALRRERESLIRRAERLKKELERLQPATHTLAFLPPSQSSEVPLLQAQLLNIDGTLPRLDERIEIASKRAASIASNLWLIPTAEVPLTNLVRESIVDEAELPMRLTALTPCFRAEAGAAGKDTRGMIRQHQFTKVELVSITTPEQSKDEHERMLACAEEVLRRLDLHYRVVTLCTGDMGFASQKTYDIEVWLPGQNAYREISSCSVCGEFQARRMNARYRGKESRQPRFVHTLNGSGVAVGRALIAVMETYQQQDGSIAVPDVLQSYMGGLKTIEHAA